MKKNIPWHYKRQLSRKKDKTPRLGRKKSKNATKEQALYYLLMMAGLGFVRIPGTNQWRQRSL